jgi:hypothetical protein
VTGCLACRGDPKERAVNAVDRYRNPDYGLSHSQNGCRAARASNADANDSSIEKLIGSVPA